MTYTRSRYVQVIMDDIEQSHKGELKGIVTTHEVGRVCIKIRTLLSGCNISDKQKERLADLSMLMRRFTVAEANYVAAVFTMDENINKLKLVHARMAEIGKKKGGN